MLPSYGDSSEILLSADLLDFNQFQRKHLKSRLKHYDFDWTLTTNRLSFPLLMSLGSAGWYTGSYRKTGFIFVLIWIFLVITA